MEELTLPDLQQCQAEIKEGSFMTLGPRAWRRCTNPPTAIATEREPDSQGRFGSMSLCDECMGKMIEQLGCGYAEISKINKE